MVAAADGHVWIATTAGAARLPPEEPWTGDRIETLTRADGLPHDLLSAVLEDREGGIWFGTHAAPAGGLSLLKGGRWRHWTLKDGLPHADIVCLLIDREGRLWAGCGLYDRGGAAVFVPGPDGWRMSGTLPVAEMAGPKVRSLWEDSAGRLWIGSEFDGLAVRFGDRTLRILTTDDGLAGQEIMAIAGTPDGAVWLGTIDGLTRIGADAVTRLFPEPAPGRIP
jgi:ligand-binding sensor domain-containing protein